MHTEKTSWKGVLFCSLVVYFFVCVVSLLLNTFEYVVSIFSVVWEPTHGFQHMSVAERGLSPSKTARWLPSSPDLLYVDVPSLASSSVFRILLASQGDVFKHERAWGAPHSILPAMPSFPCSGIWFWCCLPYAIVSAESYLRYFLFLSSSPHISTLPSL